MNDLLAAILRTDFLAFIERTFQEVVAGEPFEHNWHLEAIAYALTEVANGSRKRQIIEVPPRSLKSIAASVALPAWILGHNPTAKIMCVSYSQDLANRFASMTRQAMKSVWYKAVFPNTRISPVKDTESYFVTTAGGYRDAVSVGGTLTGKGASLIIIDDPAKPDEMMSESQRKSVADWYSQTLVSRLNNKRTDRILLVMQRLHQDDLAGHVRTIDEWDILTLPSIATKAEEIPIGPGKVFLRKEGDLLFPERETHEVLMQLRASMGTYAFSAQYQQEPVPPDSAIIPWEWFKRSNQVPEGAKIVQSWDCASKATEFSDYSVCTTWAIVDKVAYLICVFRKKLEFPELLKQASLLAESYRPSEILIEDAGAGTALLQSLRMHGPVGMPQPKAIKPKSDKQTRLHIVSALVEAGRVYLPEQASWLADFKNELVQFPHGKHDDQVDSMSQFLAWFDKTTSNPNRAERRSMFFD